MRLLNWMLLCLITVPSWAFKTTILHIEPARNSTEPTLLYLENGQVGFLESTHSFLKLSGPQRAEITLDQRQRVKSIEFLQTDKSLQVMPLFSAPPYQPTLFPDLASAQKIFNGMNPNARGRSQCYNRAHVWSYEENKKHGIYFMKVFMFFTAKYIRDYDYGWWFHVSPFAYVNENGVPTERVMDFEFTKSPTLMKTWSDYFIFAKTECPTISKYSDYSEHQYDHYCYHAKVSMYYWQPLDVENFEKTNIEKTDFIQAEVNAAYRQAF